MGDLIEITKKNKENQERLKKERQKDNDKIIKDLKKDERKKSLPKKM